jgi:hypothetical protein
MQKLKTLLRSELSLILATRRASEVGRGIQMGQACLLNSRLTWNFFRFAMMLHSKHTKVHLDLFPKSRLFCSWNK